MKYLNYWHNTQLVEPEKPKNVDPKYIPHSYTKEELHRFFAECNKPYVFRAEMDRERRNLIVPVIYRLLYSTGMRTVEARLLKREDVRLDNGVVGIAMSKGYDQHYIVLHDTMLALMVQFDMLISKFCPSRTYFFPGYHDAPITQMWLDAVFRKLWERANSTYARLYDMRHNYATQNINSWLSSGLSYHSKLVYLSKSMGHRDVRSTKYYYSLVPALADVLEQQAGASFDELIPEVEDEKDF